MRDKWEEDGGKGRERMEREGGRERSGDSSGKERER